MIGKTPFAVVAALCLTTALCAHATFIRTDVNPRRLTVGDVGEILLVSNDKPPRIEKLPQLPWLRWLDEGVPMTRREFRIINNREDRRFSARYRFRAVTEGEFAFPKLTATEGDAKKTCLLYTSPSPRDA